MTTTISAEAAAAAMAEVSRQLAAFDRRPFRKVLADLIGATPTPAALAAFAARYPDKWAQAVTIFAGLAGFEKGLVSLNVYNVGSMSDAQVLAEINRGDRELERMGLRRQPVVIGAGGAEAPPPAAGEPPALPPPPAEVVAPEDADGS